QAARGAGARAAAQPRPRALGPGAWHAFRGADVPDYACRRGRAGATGGLGLDIPGVPQGASVALAPRYRRRWPQSVRPPGCATEPGGIGWPRVVRRITQRGAPAGVTPRDRTRRRLGGKLPPAGDATGVAS